MSSVNYANVYKAYVSFCEGAGLSKLEYLSSWFPLSQNTLFVVEKTRVVTLYREKTRKVLKEKFDGQDNFLAASGDSVISL